MCKSTLFLQRGSLDEFNQVKTEKGTEESIAVCFEGTTLGDIRCDPEWYFRFEIKRMVWVDSRLVVCHVSGTAATPYTFALKGMSIGETYPYLLAFAFNETELRRHKCCIR